MGLDGERDGVLIFPEGTRFTREKLAAFKSEAQAKEPRARRARSRACGICCRRAVRRPDGVARRRRLTRRSSSAGTSGSTTFTISGRSGAAGWSGRGCECAFWRHERDELPSGRDELIDWLYDRWQALDDWIEEQRSRPRRRRRARRWRAWPKLTSARARISPADVLTVGNGVCGFLAMRGPRGSVDRPARRVGSTIVSSSRACSLYGIGMLFDVLDGPVARRFGSSGLGTWPRHDLRHDHLRLAAGDRCLLARLQRGRRLDGVALVVACPLRRRDDPAPGAAGAGSSSCTPSARHARRVDRPISRSRACPRPVGGNCVLAIVVLAPPPAVSVGVVALVAVLLVADFPYPNNKTVVGAAYVAALLVASFAALAGLISLEVPSVVALVGSPTDRRRARGKDASAWPLTTAFPTARKPVSRRGRCCDRGAGRVHGLHRQHDRLDRVPEHAGVVPGLDLSSLSWVFNIYNIALAALLVPAGRIADIAGRTAHVRVRRDAVHARVGLCAVAPSVGVLIAARALQGAGAAILIPASLGLILHASPEEQRTQAIALWSATGALAAGIGPSIGGLLVSPGDWRLVFLINLPVGVVSLVASPPRAARESGAAGGARCPTCPAPCSSPCRSGSSASRSCRARAGAGSHREIARLRRSGSSRRSPSPAGAVGIPRRSSTPSCCARAALRRPTSLTSSAAPGSSRLGSRTSST